MNAVTTITISETNISPPLPNSTSSLTRSDFIKSSGCISFLLSSRRRAIKAGPNEVTSTGGRPACGFRRMKHPAMIREPSCLGELSPQEVNRLVAYQLLSGGIYRVAHSLSQY
jgi:hypothetical protein